MNVHKSTFAESTVILYDMNMLDSAQKSIMGLPIQLCPKCDEEMGAMPGGRDATCKNCGFKDPCCE